MIRTVVVILWTLICIPVQAVLLALPDRAGLRRGKVVFARLYWAGVCHIIGIGVRVLGNRARTVPSRPVVYVSNHASWIDIPLLGGRLEACFVSKAEVAGWPGISLIARLGRTVFVSRQRGSALRETAAMRGRLAAGDGLILFPEGTSSDGSRVLPFRSAFLAIAMGDDPPIIQPVSVVYDRVAHLPIGRMRRGLFAWYGDMDLASHFWQLAQANGLRATLLLHPTIDPVDYVSRKDLSQACWRVVADGASALRQNREPRVLLPAVLRDAA